MYVRDDPGQVKVAHAISGRLNTVLAQRVAFLTICIVVTMPIFNMFQYPESDGSFTSWAKLLAVNVEAKLASPNSTLSAVRLDSELQRFSDFYRDLNYGPYEVCIGDGSHCLQNAPALTFSSPFENSSRSRSGVEVPARARLQVAVRSSLLVTRLRHCATSIWRCCSSLAAGWKLSQATSTEGACGRGCAGAPGVCPARSAMGGRPRAEEGDKDPGKMGAARTSRALAHLGHLSIPTREIQQTSELVVLNYVRV